MATTTLSAPPSTTSAGISFGPTLPPDDPRLNSPPKLSQGSIIGIFIGVVFLVCLTLMCFRFSRLSRRDRTAVAFMTCSRRYPDESVDTDAERGARISASFPHGYPQTSGLSPSFLLTSNLGAIPTTGPSHLSYEHGQTRITRAADTDAGGRRAGPPPTEDGYEFGDVKLEELPPYERRAPGLPTYVDSATVPALPREASSPPPSETISPAYTTTTLATPAIAATVTASATPTQ